MNALDALASSLLTAAESSSQWAVGTVATVTAGAAADGNPLVTVSWQGKAIRAAYASSYTPVTGHVVLMARVGPQLAIVCRLIGTPPAS